MIKYTQFCRLCKNPHLDEILNLSEQHVQGAFYTKNNPNPPKRKIPNKLIRCNPLKGGCGLVQSNITCPPEILFSSYFYKTGINELMVKHMEYIVHKLLQFNPNPRSVLDIAASDLTLLKKYPTSVDRWGIDPNDIITKVDPAGIRVINDFFPSPLIPKKPMFDFCSILAVMYDLDEPLSFLKSAFGRLTKDGVLCLEVMYLPTIIEKLSYDTVLFEHVTHWSLYTLELLVRAAGGKLLNVELTPTNGGSILVFTTGVESTKHNKKEYQDNILALKKKEFDMALDDIATFNKFRNDVTSHISKLHETVRKLKEEGKTICLYGASTKATVIVESSLIEPYLSYAIERSEEKFGGQTIWGLPIISEQEAREKADANTVWLCAPYFFKESFVARETQFKQKGGTFLFPLPEISLE